MPQSCLFRRSYHHPAQKYVQPYYIIQRSKIKMFHVKHFQIAAFITGGRIQFSFLIGSGYQLDLFSSAGHSVHLSKNKSALLSIPKSNSKIVMLPPLFNISPFTISSIFYSKLFRSCIFRFNASSTHFDIFVPKAYFCSLQAKIQSRFCTAIFYFR